MTQFPTVTPAYTAQNGTPIQNYSAQVSATPVNTAQQGSVSVSTPNGGSQVYSYPTTSVYNPEQKQGASGVNIYIYNPSAIGGPTTNTNWGQPNGCPPVSGQNGNANANANTTIANTPINTENTEDSKKKKKIVELTDDYIKTLESYLKSADADVRKSGIVDLINRFEEESSRYDDPALTALLNIALQDPNPNNRMLAMSPVAGENAHGDQNTINLLKALQKSDKVYGQEAKMANEALLKCAQTKKEVSA